MMHCCPGWDSFEITPSAVDGPVAFSADLSPASILGAYQRGIFPFPAADEFARDINEFRYEDRVAEGEHRRGRPHSRRSIPGGVVVT